MIRDFENRDSARFRPPVQEQAVQPPASPWATGVLNPNAHIRSGNFSQAGQNAPPPNVGSVLQGGFRAGNMNDGRIPGRGNIGGGRFDQLNPNAPPPPMPQLGAVGQNVGRRGIARDQFQQQDTYNAPLMQYEQQLAPPPMSGGDSYWANRGDPAAELQQQQRMNQWQQQMNMMNNGYQQKVGNDFLSGIGGGNFNQINQGNDFLSGIGGGNFNQINPGFQQQLPQTQNPYMGQQNPMLEALNSYRGGY